MSLGKRLRSMRERFLLTEEQLAKCVNVSRQMIVKWDSDLSVPNNSNLQKLSELFCVSPEYLLGNEDFSLLNMKVELDKDKYGNKLTSYEFILREYFSDCEIYNLVRSKKMSKVEAVIDFFVFGFSDDVDSLRDLSPYYLIKKEGHKFLVNIKDWTMKISELPLEISDKKFVFGNNKFVNCGRLDFKSNL